MHSIKTSQRDRAEVIPTAQDAQQKIAQEGNRADDFCAYRCRPVSPLVPGEQISSKAHPYGRKKQDHTSQPGDLARVLVGTVDDDPEHVEDRQRHHRRGPPMMETSHEPAEREGAVDVDDRVVGVLDAWHVVDREQDSRHELVDDDEQGRAAEERRSILNAYTDLLQSPLTPSSGGTDTDITVIEFYDYQCAPCRASYPELQQVRTTEPGVRYLYGQLPIYGSHSIMAARAAVAAHRQGLFKEFHHALMTTDSGLDMKVIFATAEKAGLDVEKLQADMRDPLVHQYLEEVRALAEALDVTGTPSFIIGDAKLIGCLQSIPDARDLLKSQGF